MVVGYLEYLPVAGCGSELIPDVMLKISGYSDFIPPLATTTDDIRQMFVSPSPSATPYSTEANVSGLPKKDGFPTSYVIAIVSGVGVALVVLVVGTLFCFVF